MTKTRYAVLRNLRNNFTQKNRKGMDNVARCYYNPDVFLYSFLRAGSEQHK